MVNWFQSRKAYLKAWVKYALPVMVVWFAIGFVTATLVGCVTLTTRVGCVNTPAGTECEAMTSLGI